jgi:hypothetical protein
MLQQSTIQKLASPTQWLRSGCFLIDATSLWDPGWSHNLQRCLQPYLKVNGVLLPQWLHRPAYHWRTARSTSRCMCPRRPCDPPPAALTSSLPWIAPPCSYLVSRHMCYLVFFRGPFCKLTVVMSICVCVRERVCCKKKLLLCGIRSFAMGGEDTLQNFLCWWHEANSLAFFRVYKFAIVHTV